MAVLPAAQSKILLEDVLNDYILGKLDAIRKQPIPTLFAKPEQGPASVEMVEMHCDLAPQYFATLDLYVPSLKVHQEVLTTLCKRYLLLGARPKTREVKDWASKEAGDLRCMVVHALNLCKRATTSRSGKVSFLKQFILDLRIKGGGDPHQCVESALQAAVEQEQETESVTTPAPSPNESVPTPTSKAVSPDEVETQLEALVENFQIDAEPPAPDTDQVMHVDGLRRQAEKDRKPLESDKPEIRKDIEEAAVCQVPTFEGPHDVYNAQLAKSRAAKVLSAEKVLQKAQGDPKVQKKLKKPTKGRGRGRGRGKEATGCEVEAGGEHNEVEGGASACDKGESTAEGGEGHDRTDDPKAAAAAQIAEDWKIKEPLLKSAGIPIPEGAGSNKSFSLKPIPGSIEGAASLGILWSADQIYVNKVMVPAALPEGLAANRKKGCTITTKKRGGWSSAFVLAQKIAGWV